MNNDIERVIYSQEDIAKRETELASQICEADYCFSLDWGNLVLH